MGNRAVIKGKGNDLGVYVHWNGGYNSVYAFTQYCKLKGYRSPEVDDYGIARLCQVIGNFFGGSTSVGVWAMSECRELSPEMVDKFWLDNGVYELENWEIVKHWNCDLVQDDVVSQEELVEFLCEIDKCMPVKEQLGEVYLKAETVLVSELQVGDKVYVLDFLRNTPELFEVMGFGNDGAPYINKYNHDGDWSWNGNNYIRVPEVKRVR